jgi:hypothetical protein
LCKVADWPYGLCLCPDVDAQALAMESSAFYAPPRSWGAPATKRAVGSCKPATAPGWVDEVVHAGEIGAMAAAANGNQVHVLTGSELGTQHWIRAEDGSWSEQVFTDKKASSLALAFDAAGNLRAALCARSELSFVADAIIPMDDSCLSVNLALAGDGQAALAYYVLGSGTKVARQAGAEWTTRLVSDVLLGGRPSLTFDGQGTLHVVNDPLIHIAIGSGEPQVEDLGYGTGPRLAGAGAAQPVLVWSDSSDSTVEFMRLNEEPASPTQVWIETDPRVADEPTHPRVTYGPDGKPWIVHRAPGGLSLLREDESGWRSTPLVPELPPLPDWFDLVFDASGAPHLLYVVEPGPIPTAFEQELRHAYQGSCKTQ